MDKGLTFILHPGIQIQWPRASIDASVIAYLVQLYSVLLSALLSINRQQLSLFDANYTLVISSSPLTLQLVFVSICDLFGFKSNPPQWIQSHRRTICTFGALFLPLWFGLNLTILLSSQAFKDSELCAASGPPDIFMYFLDNPTPLTLSISIILLSSFYPIAVGILFSLGLPYYLVSKFVFLPLSVLTWFLSICFLTFLFLPHNIYLLDIDGFFCLIALAAQCLPENQGYISVIVGTRSTKSNVI